MPEHRGSTVFTRGADAAGGRIGRAVRGWRRTVAAFAATLIAVAGIAQLAAVVPAAAASSLVYASATGGATSGTCSTTATVCTLPYALTQVASAGTVDLTTSGVEGAPSTYYSGGFSVGNPVTIQPAPGVVNPILDGGGTQPVLAATGLGTLAIGAVTIQHGNSSTGSAIQLGTGVSLTLIGTTVADNTGGPAITGGETVTPLTTIDISSATFTGNTSGIGAAAMNVDGPVTISDSTFDDNSAPGPGAIYLYAGSLTVTGSTFSANKATARGGAALGVDYAPLTVSNSTFAGNQAAGQGAVNIQSNGSSIVDSTFAGNTQTTAGNGSDVTNGYMGTVTLAGDIFTGSCVGSVTTNATPFADDGYNVGTGSSCFVGGAGDLTDANLATQLTPLGNFGGPTQTVTLLPGNSALGLVPDPTTVGTSPNTFALCPVTDQRGVASLAGTACNAGSTQLAGQTITVTTAAPPTVNIGAPSYAPAATASSGLPVAITLDATSAGCALSGGVVSFMSAGTCVIDFNQAGNTSTNPAAQVQQSITVNPYPQTVTFTTTAPTGVVVGSPSYAPAASATSGLAVAIILDATSTGCSLAGGTVTFTAVGTCVIDANQPGNITYAPAPQAQQKIAVGQASTTIAVTSSAHPSVVGQAVTYTATVTVAGQVAPTGSVTFDDGATAITCGPGSHGFNGTSATCAVAYTATSGSPHSITAVYSGDGNFGTSTSPAVSQVVNAAPTATAVTTSTQPSTVGQAVTLTATVSVPPPGSGTPTGTVTFSDGSNPLTCGTGTPFNGTTATCVTSALGAGSHVITASYGGDANFDPSTSAALVQVVNASNTTTVVTTNPATTAPYGAPVTLNVTVTPTSPGVGTPTGVVQISDGTTPVCTNVPLVAGTGDAIASCTVSPAVGGHTFTASFAGGGGFSGSVSAGVAFSVTQATPLMMPPVISPTTPSSSSSLVVGQSATLLTTVTGGGTAPTGTLTC